MSKITKKKVFLIALLSLSILLGIWILTPKNRKNMKCFGYEYKKKNLEWEGDYVGFGVYNYYCIGITYDYLEAQYNNGKTCFKIGATCRGEK